MIVKWLKGRFDDKEGGVYDKSGCHGDRCDFENLNKVETITGVTNR